MNLSNSYLPIKKELEAVRELLRVTLRNESGRRQQRFHTFFTTQGGKLLRPAMLILCFKALTYRRRGSPSLNRETTLAAAALECLHQASLVHDDIIDNSPLRHGRPSAVKNFGSDIAIVLGDILIASAYKLLSCCQLLPVRTTITNAFTETCEGQLLQLMRRGDYRVSEHEYHAIIKKKTASAFSAACAVGAIIPSQQKYIDKFKNLGLWYGTAFQMIDDLLDIVANSKRTGKPMFQDFAMGEMTLPLIHLFREYDTKQRASFIKSFGTAQTDHVRRSVQQFFKTSQAMIKVKDEIKIALRRVNLIIQRIPPSPYRASLAFMTKLLEQSVSLDL